MGDTNGTALTVAVDVPSARVLAGQASVVADLQFVMDCCRRLLTELSRAEEDRDGVVPLALWSSAVVAYARCFGPDPGSGLTAGDVQSLRLQGAVMSFHEWVMGERDKLTAAPADPFQAAKIGAVLSPAAGRQRRVKGIGVFAASRVLIDVTGVKQLGALASELARQTAVKAQQQQDVVLADTQRLDMERLYASPRLQAQPPGGEAAG